MALQPVVAQAKPVGAPACCDQLRRDRQEAGGLPLAYTRISLLVPSMQRVNNLWDQVTSFENLYHAAYRVLRGKRDQRRAADFFFRLEENLLRLQRELRSQTYCPGAYRTFWITTPKRRMISAAPFRDRVVHHALINVIEPVFERRFIHHSYACRIGKGTHRALQQFVAWGRSSRYVLKMDIHKFFPTLDHTILKEWVMGQFERGKAVPVILSRSAAKAKNLASHCHYIRFFGLRPQNDRSAPSRVPMRVVETEPLPKECIRRTIKDPEVLWLCDLIIDCSNEQEEVVRHFPGDELFTPLSRRRGIPIGNLTSQFLANVYLDRLDHFVKDQLRVKRYLRYVDDFCCFHDDKRELTDLRAVIAEFLLGLRLQLNEGKSRVRRVKEGVEFLGFVVFPEQLRLNQTAVRRQRRRLRLLQCGYASGLLSWYEVARSLQAWNAHAKYGTTWKLRQDVFGHARFRRSPCS